MKQHRPRVGEENYTKLERYTGDSFDDRLSSLLLLKSFREQEIDNLKMDVELLQARIEAVKTNFTVGLISVLTVTFILMVTV